MSVSRARRVPGLSIGSMDSGWDVEHGYNVPAERASLERLEVTRPLPLYKLCYLAFHVLSRCMESQHKTASLRSLRLKSRIHLVTMSIDALMHWYTPGLWREVLRRRLPHFVRSPFIALQYSAPSKPPPLYPSLDSR